MVEKEDVGKRIGVDGENRRGMRVWN